MKCIFFTIIHITCITWLNIYQWWDRKMHTSERTNKWKRKTWRAIVWIDFVRERDSLERSEGVSETRARFTVTLVINLRKDSIKCYPSLYTTSNRLGNPLANQIMDMSHYHDSLNGCLWCRVMNNILCGDNRVFVSLSLAVKLYKKKIPLAVRLDFSCDDRFFFHCCQIFQWRTKFKFDSCVGCGELGLIINWRFTYRHILKRCKNVVKHFERYPVRTNLD